MSIRIDFVQFFSRARDRHDLLNSLSRLPYTTVSRLTPHTHDVVYYDVVHYGVVSVDRFDVRNNRCLLFLGRFANKSFV